MASPFALHEQMHEQLLGTPGMIKGITSNILESLDKLALIRARLDRMFEGDYEPTINKTLLFTGLEKELNILIKRLVTLIEP
jgi:hypothetical protein